VPPYARISQQQSSQRTTAQAQQHPDKKQIRNRGDQELKPA
jgi:hypothetical protein